MQVRARSPEVIRSGMYARDDAKDSHDKPACCRNEVKRVKQWSGIIEANVNESSPRSHDQVS